MQKQRYNWLLWLLKGLSLYVEELYLEVIMDFKSFLIAFVVGMFVSFITYLIREKFLKSPKKNKDRSNQVKRFFYRQFNLQWSFFNIVSPVKMICDSRIKNLQIKLVSIQCKGQVCFSCLLFKFFTIQDVLMTIYDLSDPRSK